MLGQLFRRLSRAVSRSLCYPHFRIRCQTIDQECIMHEEHTTHGFTRLLELAQAAEPQVRERLEVEEELCTLVNQELRRAAAGLVNGYGADGIWQFFDPADPRGETGKKDKRVVPWPQWLQFEGSEMIQPVRSLLPQYASWQLEPHRDWLLVDGKPSPLPTATDLMPPHCAAIPGELYLIYIPRGNASRAVRLTNLHEKRYRGQWYNPRTAESAPLADAPTGAAEWPIPQRPSPSDEDWILCLEKRS